jgi:hypothetical protein
MGYNTDSAAWKRCDNTTQNKSIVSTMCCPIDGFGHFKGKLARVCSLLATIFHAQNSLAIDYELNKITKIAGSVEKPRWKLQILGGKLDLVQSVVMVNDSDDETPPVNFNFSVSADVLRPNRLALFDDEVQQLNRTKMFQLKPS